MKLPQKKTLALAVVAGNMAITGTPQVFAQNEYGLEEVVVTASRRTEGVQDIPYNITAITGADLKNYGATDLSKMAQFIPGMQMIDSGARSTNLVTLRGLNVGALEASENQGGKDIISRYVGDTPMLIDLKLIDVERVEVLRGPQGTLYGRGAMGGTLRYILNKPDTEALTADLNSRLYGYEEGDGLSYDVNGTLNLPLTDTLALRVSAGYLDDDGFVDYPLVLAEPGISNAVNPAKDVNTEKTESLRASLRWEPSDTLYVQGNYFLQDTKAGGRQAVNPPFTGDDWDSSLRYKEPRHNKDQLGNLEIGWTTPYFDLFSSTSYTTYNGHGNRDQTDLLCVDIYPGYCNFPEFSSFTIEDSQEDVFIQEARFLSNSEGPIDWLLGFYYEEDRTKTSSEEFTPGYQDWAGIDTGFGELEYWNYSKTNFDERAVFGEVTWHATDALQLTGGARYFKQKEDVAYDCTLVPIYWFYTDVPIVPQCESGNADVSDHVYKINTSYNFTDDIMAYLTWAQGFRSGGANLGPSEGQVQLSPEERSFDPDKTENYELGWHTQWWDNRVIFNGAIFWTEWKDLQVPTKSDVGGINIIENGRQGEVKGFELSTQAALTEALRVTAWATYYDNGLTEDAPEIDGFDGDNFPGIPEWQFNLAADYTMPLASGDLVFRANAYYKDSVDTRLNDIPPNDDNVTLDSYTVVNFSAAYETQDWALTLFADNAFAEDYYTGGRGAARYGERGQFFYAGAPRTFGLEFSYHFQK